MIRRLWKSLLVALLLCIPQAVLSNKTGARLDSILQEGIRDTATLHKAIRLITDDIAEGRITDSLIVSAHALLEQARRMKDDAAIGDALLNLVRCYLNRYESTKSLEYALEGYSLYEKHNNQDKMAYMLLQIGIIYYTQNNFSKSLEYYNNSVSAFEKTGDKSYIGTLYYLSGINYSKLKNYPSALSFFNRAKKIKTDLKDEQGQAECNIGLAELYLGMEVPDTALMYLNLAQQYTSGTGNTYGMAKGNILMAEALFQKEMFDDARTHAKKGMEQANSINVRELMMDASKILYRISEREKDFRNAFIHVLNYMNMRDSIINEKTSRNMSRMEGDYIIEKKQSEILLLEKENRNRTILLRASVIIGILALMLSLLYYNKHQMKQKANQKLEKAYHELETTQQQLVQQEKLASLGQLTAGIAHEIKNPLNFVNNFSLLSVELLRELRNTEDHGEREALLNDISTNIEKIAHHGERANSIVTRMLEHSRTGRRELELTDINKLIKEYMQLGYQAVRIKYPGFSCNLSASFDEKIPEINLVSQEISRVFLNIFNNCLYAVMLKHADDRNYKPEMSVRTQLQQDQIQIEIRDNGPGIPESIMEQIFQPFFTTKPAGEGTGLGLSISHDIIKAHGGTLVAGNRSSGGAEFIITLPVK